MTSARRRKGAMKPGHLAVSPPRTRRRPGDVADWLRTGPCLQEMREAYPQEWKRVDADVAALVERADAEELQTYLSKLTQPPARRPGHLPPRQELISDTIRQQMAIHAVTAALLAAEAGVSDGHIALGRWNRRLMEKLFLSRSSTRKAVSLTAFRLVWPLLTQRRRLMPIMFEQGVYCFYSHSLLRGVERLIAGRACFEIAAGDGTLTRLLTEREFRSPPLMITVGTAPSATGRT